MLYIATQGDVPVRSSPELSVEEVEPSREAVRQWFSLPVVRFVGAHTGCSCGFPHIVMAQEPGVYWDGLFDPGDARDADLRSVRALFIIIQEQVIAFGGIELYPVWAGNEHLQPKGTIDWSLESLDPQTFLLTEQFFYRIARESSSDPAQRVSSANADPL